MPPCRRAQGQKGLLQVQRDGRGLPAALLLHHGDGAGYLRGGSWGFRGRAELEAAGADYVVDTQAELAALVLGE